MTMSDHFMNTTDAYTQENAWEQKVKSALMPEYAPLVPVSKNPQWLIRNPMDPMKREQVEAKIYTELNEQLKAFADESFFNVLRDNIGSQGTGINVVRRMSVMAGGAPMFQEPRTPEGHTGPTHTELIAVIPHMQQTRRMFKAAYGTAGSDRIPDCTSVNVSRDRTFDMGFGNPGGECRSCEHDMFVDGVGRACSERQALFVLIDGQPFPYYIDLSVYSQRPIQAYSTELLSQRLSYWQVVHKIKLAQTNARNGQSVAIFSAEPIGIIDATDPIVCKGLENLRTLSQMVLRDFAMLVQNSKNIRLNQATPDRLQGLQQSAAQNLPLPPGQANQVHPGIPAASGMPLPNDTRAASPVTSTVVVEDPMAALQQQATYSSPYIEDNQQVDGGFSGDWSSGGEDVIEMYNGDATIEMPAPQTNGEF